MWKIKEILGKKPKNFENFDENRIKTKQPFSYKLKKFLKWLDLRDEYGDRLITEDTVISEIFKSWSKRFLVWSIEIFFTGLLIFIALFPLFKLHYLFIFSYGLCWYIGLVLIREIRNSWVKKNV